MIDFTFNIFKTVLFNFVSKVFPMKGFFFYDNHIYFLLQSIKFTKFLHSANISKFIILFSYVHIFEHLLDNIQSRLSIMFFFLYKTSYLLNSSQSIHASMFKMSPRWMMISLFFSFKWFHKFIVYFKTYLTICPSNNNLIENWKKIYKKKKKNYD